MRRKTSQHLKVIGSNPVRPSAQYQIRLRIYFETGAQGNPSSEAGSSSTSGRWSKCNRVLELVPPAVCCTLASGTAVLLGEMQQTGLCVEWRGRLRTRKSTSQKWLAEVKLLRNSNNLDHLNTHFLPAFPFSSFVLLKHRKRALATGSGIPGNK